MSITVTKEINFCAAHRLVGYQGPCKNIHGHNYKVFITLRRNPLDPGAALLDKLGLVIDFKVIKEKIKTWIDNELDHALIINENDTALHKFAINSSMKHFIMPSNATAENLAKLILFKARAIFAEDPQLSFLEEGVKMSVPKVIIYETDTSSAEAK